MQPSYKSPSYLDEIRQEYEEHFSSLRASIADAERGYAERTLLGVEIFRTGTHNGDTYSERDLDDIISAFASLDYRPAIKLGHDHTPGAPAYGWVANVRRKGDKLVADFRHMNEGVYEAIKRGKYARLSPEIYFNLNRDGKRYRRALKAVALLGAEVPAVAGLRPLHRSFVGDAELAIYSATPLTYTGMENDGNAGDRLHRQILAYRARHPEVKRYSDAMAAVLAEDNELRAAYATFSNAGDSRSLEETDTQRLSNAMGTADPRERYAAGLEIEKKMREEMERFPAMRQMEALKRVLQKYPKLAAAYRASPTTVPNYDAVMGS